MPNATKYFAEFRDLHGNQWRVNIHDSEFGGTTPTEFTLGGSGFVISYKGDTENVFQPVIGSSVEFDFYEQTAAHTAFLDSLATANESRYTITIERLIGGAYELQWFGVALADQWAQVNEPLPRMSRIVASDDLGNLNAILYKVNAATAYTGTDTLLNHLVNGLTKTRALHPFAANDVFLRVADDFRPENTNAVSRFLENIRTHHESFWKIDDSGNREFMSAFDVVLNVCKSQNARLFLANGMFHFVPLGAYQNASNIVWHEYNVAGDYVATTAAQNVEIELGLEIRDMAGNEKRFTPPMLQVRRKQSFNGNAPVIWETYIDQQNLTSPISDFGVDYFVGQQINFVGVVNVNLAGAEPFNLGNAQISIGRIAVNVQFKCGDLYAVAPISFGATGIFGFDDGSIGNYDLPNYGVLAWTANAGATTFLSEPFDRAIGTNQNIGLAFSTPLLPSTQSSLEITLAIQLCKYDGTLVDLDDGLNAADVPEYHGLNFRVYRADVDGGGSDITFTAIGDDVNRAIKIDDVVVLGDRIGDSDRGVLQVKTGVASWADATGWTSLMYTGNAVGVNRLAVNEILRTMRAPMPILAGAFDVRIAENFDQIVSFLNVLKIENDRYIFTEFAFHTNQRILDFEIARIQRSTAAIDEIVSGKSDTNGDVVPFGFNPIVNSVGLNAAVATNTTAIDNLESTTSTIQTKVALINVTQPVNLDTLESNVENIDVILSFLKETFQTKSDPTKTITKIVHDAGKTDGLEMSLTQTTAAFSSNSGNTELTISESTNGVFSVALQDETNQTSTALMATGDSRGNRIGVNTNAPAYELDVAGIMNAADGIYIGGAPFAINDCADVDVATIPPVANQVLKWNGTKWSPADDDSGGGGGGGSDSFNTIAVPNQTSIVADNGNDTLTIIAGSNVVITTDAARDELTFGVAPQPVFDGLTINGNIIATGTISAVGGLATFGTLNAAVGVFTSNVNVAGTFTSNGAIIGSAGLTFTGGGTSVIGPANSLPNTPDDLLIQSNGNVIVVLDLDDDETNQSFKVQNGNGETIFEVNENGISSGLFTTPTPTIATIDDFESTQTGTITITNYNNLTAYAIELFDSSNTKISHTITDNANGTFTIASGLLAATNYYVKIRALGFGLFVSATAESNQFDCLTAQTQKRFWRLVMTNANKVPAKTYVGLGQFHLFTAANATGTRWPTSNMTANNAPSPFVASAGFTQGGDGGSYPPFRAFDAAINSGSMWWNLGIPSAAQSWIQIDLGSSVNLASCQIATSGAWTSANYAVLYGSDTGAFTGEQREMAFFQNIKTAGEAGGTFSTFTENVT